MIGNRNPQLGYSSSGGGAHNMKPKRVYQVWRGSNVSSYFCSPSPFVLIIGSYYDTKLGFANGVCGLCMFDLNSISV